MDKVFAEIGKSLQQVGGKRPDGFIEMVGQRPGQHNIAQADGTWGGSPPQYPVFTGNAKLDLFTPGEQLAVVTAAMSDAVVKLMYDRLLNAAYLTYEDPEMQRGLQLLVDKGLLTQERKVLIVTEMQPR